MAAIQEEYEQRYAANPPAAVQVWVYCRLCRCRIQVRTIPTPDLPFRCFCGNEATFARFDVFTDEGEVARFAQMFETLYQETKALMREAAMPMPKTRMYTADEMRKLKSGELVEPADETSASSDEGSGEREAPESGEFPRPVLATDDAPTFLRRSRELTEAVQKARDVFVRHEALNAVGKYTFTHRERHIESRRLCYQACYSDVSLARELLREATARFRRGERVVLKFSLFKRLITLHCEDDQPERALEVALHAQSLGIPGYDDHVLRLKAQVAKRPPTRSLPRPR
jgi:hypothetical protein